MIDLIINETGGLTVAHDEKSLDAADAISIALPGGAATLRGPGLERPVASLAPPMLEMLRPGMTGRIVRFSGWSIARVAPLAVLASQE